MKKNSNYKKWALLALAAGLWVATTPAAMANITCNHWQTGSGSGDQVFDCDFSTGYTCGDYNNSYRCDNLFGRFCFVNYTGGNSYHGDCTIVVKTYTGQSYCCDVNNWDGKELIRCDFIPFFCKEIQIYCPHTPGTTPVPEPSTIVAAALLLIPFGLSVVRIFRKQKTVVPIA